MDDRPLFQNMDEQEKAYAPQQLSDGSTSDQATPVEEGGSGVASEAAALPVAATGAAVHTAGTGQTAGQAGGSAGTTSGVLPAVGAVALAAHIEETNADDRRE